MNDFLNFTLAILVAGFLITGCSPEWKEKGGEVEAVYWHENQRYTVVTVNADVVEHQRIAPWGHTAPGAVTLYTDVEPGEKSWYKCRWEWNAWSGADNDTAYCEIHIHDLDELGTADWNHGKFGSGATERID